MKASFITWCLIALDPHRKQYLIYCSMFPRIKTTMTIICKVVNDKPLMLKPLICKLLSLRFIVIAVNNN